MTLVNIMAARYNGTLKQLHLNRWDDISREFWSAMASAVPQLKVTDLAITTETDEQDVSIIQSNNAEPLKAVALNTTLESVHFEFCEPDNLYNAFKTDLGRICTKNMTLKASAALKNMLLSAVCQLLLSRKCCKSSKPAAKKPWISTGSAARYCSRCCRICATLRKIGGLSKSILPRLTRPTPLQIVRDVFQAAKAKDFQSEGLPDRPNIGRQRNAGPTSLSSCSDRSLEAHLAPTTNTTYDIEIGC